MLRQTPSFLVGGVIAMLISFAPGGSFEGARLFYGGLVCAVYGLVGVIWGRK